MSVRRQNYVWTLSDDGSTTADSLRTFPLQPRSIFSSGYGNANESSASTMINQFITVEAMGSTPGLFATNQNWCPRGFMNIQIENTYFFNTPDGRLNSGVSGTAAPFPISVQFQRSYNSFPRVYLGGGTSFDVTYYMASSFLGSPDTFSFASGFTMTLIS